MRPASPAPGSFAGLECEREDLFAAFQAVALHCQKVDVLFLCSLAERLLHIWCYTFSAPQLLPHIPYKEFELPGVMLKIDAQGTWCCPRMPAEQPFFTVRADGG